MNGVTTFFEGRHRGALQTLLRDGTPIFLRPVTPEDRGPVAEVFEGMSARSRYMRFLGPVPRITDRLVSFLTRVDHRDHFAWIAFHEGHAIGVARYVVVPDEPGTAEVAVSVVDEFHGRGLGRVLMEAVGAVAAARGFRTLLWEVHPENRKAAGLMRSMGVTVTFEGGLLMGRMPAASSPVTILDRDEVLALADAVCGVACLGAAA